MYVTRASHVVRALTIAGSDSGGGAGIQADLKTFAAFDVYGMSALTALTAQNTLGVQAIHPLPPDFILSQLESIFDDIGTDAVKTGMLGTSDATRVVADFIRERRLQNVVVDPVMIAKGGAPLLRDEAISAVKTNLIPLATIVTPNIPEAEVLCGFSIQSWQDCVRAARTIHSLGPKVVIVKGGHAAWDDRSALGHLTEPSPQSIATDLVFDGDSIDTVASPRIHSKKTHGTGCTFSAALTACLAKGVPLQQAVHTAKEYVTAAIREAVHWDVGSGHGPLDHSVRVPSMNLERSTIHEP